MDTAIWMEKYVNEPIRREIRLGRINAEIEMAKEEIAEEYAKEKAHPTTCATQLRQAHDNLHRWMAKKIQLEQEAA